ncbi:MAG: PEGA domain-containing protein [Deltaproteobacteria bacterium]|nr:PEGA domain-containing protein [Deltaproteobacteria bacterium]
MRALSSIVVLVAGVLLAAPARAQVPSAAAETEAREHYDRGVALFDESQFVAALAEFEAAYALTARPALLFNIGQIHARLGHAVEATDVLGRYLAEMSEIAPERRALVESEIATQRSRIGLVRVEVRTRGALLSGAAVSLDDVARGTTPLEAPLRVSAGEHVLSVVAAGHEATRERFRVAGGEERTLSLELVRDARDEIVSTSSSTVPTTRPERAFPALTVVGATLAGAGLVTFVVSGVATLLEADRLRLPVDEGGCSPSCTTAETATIDATRIVADVGLGVLVLGGVLTVIGAVLELGGPSETEGPRLSLHANGLEVQW